MASRYYSSAHYRRVCPPPDKPGEVEERIRYRAASEQAVREREAAYPAMTVENAREAMEFQERRIRELLEVTHG